MTHQNNGFCYSQINYNQSCFYLIPQEKNSCKKSRWRKIIILDSHTKEQINAYPLDEYARLLVKLKRQKKRSLGKMTGKKGIPRNKSIALRKFKKLFPNDSTRYKPDIKSSNNEDSTIKADNEEYNDENTPKLPFPLININAIQSNEVELKNKNSFDSNDKDDFQMNQYLSSLDWLLNGYNSDNAVY